MFKLKHFFIFLVSIPCICNAQKSMEYFHIKPSFVYPTVYKTDSLIASTTDVIQRRSPLAGTCELYIGNDTGYFIDVWVDIWGGKSYLGRLSPYSEIVGFVVSYAHWDTWRAVTLNRSLMWKGNSRCNDMNGITLRVKK